jgi:hypothetical protein
MTESTPAACVNCVRVASLPLPFEIIDVLRGIPAPTVARSAKGHRMRFGLTS